ncbi:MAG: hypothetical protein KF838_13970 [Phycisphaeraceae bacterium]|nr:MAG: hypothetical protein KF838_13970 [Phycisphaeraceae bacterium]
MLDRLCACVLSSFVTLLSFGQNVVTERGWVADHGDWLFFAAIDETQVVGFLAVAKPGVAQGDNLSVVWYAREDVNEWSAWTWVGTELAEIVSYVRGATAIPDLWQNDDAMKAMVGDGPIDFPVEPVELFNGLIEGDPLATILPLLPDPVASMLSLIESGYAAAPELSPSALASGSASACEALDAVVPVMRAMLNRLTWEAETDHFGGSTITTNETCASYCSGCKSVTTVITGAWGVTSSGTIGSAKHCNYSRSVTKIVAKSGLTRVLCDPCAALGYQCTVTQAGTITVLPDEPCPPAPATVFPRPPFPC